MQQFSSLCPVLLDTERFAERQIISVNLAFYMSTYFQMEELFVRLLHWVRKIWRVLLALTISYFSPLPFGEVIKEKWKRNSWYISSAWLCIVLLSQVMVPRQRRNWGELPLPWDRMLSGIPCLFYPRPPVTPLSWEDREMYAIWPGLHPISGHTALQSSERSYAIFNPDPTAISGFPL